MFNSKSCSVDIDYVNSNDPLTRKTAIPQDKFLDLTNVVLTNTWYIFTSQFYQQTESVALGGQTSSTASEMYMHSNEQTAISNELHLPKVSKRFVDDVYPILRPTHLKKFTITSIIFMKTLNILWMKKSNRELSFLDTLLEWNNGKISVLVYWKLTYTDQYLYYSCQH